MARFAEDYFSDTAGVLLQNHVPNDGAGVAVGAAGDWVKEPTSTVDLEIRSDGDKVVTSAPGTAIYLYRGAQGGSANYLAKVSAQVGSSVGGGGIFVIARHDPTVDTYYEAGHELVGGVEKWRIAKVIAGVRTVLGEIDAGTDWSFSEHIIFNFYCTNAEKRLRLTNSSGDTPDKDVLTVTDNAITAEGYAGVKIVAPSGGADNKRASIFTAEVVALAPAGTGSLSAGAASMSGVGMVAVGAPVSVELAAANMTDLNWYWHDDLGAAATDSVTDGTATTNASRMLSASTPNSTLASGQTGYLVVETLDGEFVGIAKVTR